MGFRRCAPWMVPVAVVVSLVVLGPHRARALPPEAQGLHDLVVYDPGVHERGLPEAIFRELEDGIKVDIPPVVHLHRYYYSGDKEIQGPIITGGPAVVVANHPKTGERMYVDVVLPSGAPRISYMKSGIEYVFDNQRVYIHFSKPLIGKCKATVVYRSGRGIKRHAIEKHEEFCEKTARHYQQSALAQSMKESAIQTYALVGGAHDAAEGLAAGVLDQVRGLGSIIPGSVPLVSRWQQRDERRQDVEIQAADLRLERQEIEFGPTLR